MRRILLISTLFALLLAACQSSPDLDNPPEIRYGEDICEQCNMIISEPRYAAGYVLSDGNMRRFDDIGDMLVFHSGNQEDVSVFWVHDYDSEVWMRADEARFVVSESLTTPMAHGVIAFESESKAQAMASEIGANLFSFEKVLEIDMENGLPLHTHAELLEHDVAGDGRKDDEGGTMAMPGHTMHSN